MIKRHDRSYSRLRAAGVPKKTRKDLLGHANGDITSPYSAAELNELIIAAQRITDRGIAQTPTLSSVHQTAEKNPIEKRERVCKR